ncbi:MAG: hypothetical protein L0229_25460 [Blastocatellia bacterium]|nr:hypothetical protein [Blastocatellia bacterium]
MNSRTFLKAGLWACLLLSVVACGSRPLTTGDRILADETLFSKDVSKELIEKVEQLRDHFDEEQKKFEKNRAAFEAQTEAQHRGRKIAGETIGLSASIEIPEGKQPMMEEIQKKYGDPDKTDREKADENLYMKTHYYGDIGFALPEGQEKGKVLRIFVHRVLFEKKAGS